MIENRNAQGEAASGTDRNSGLEAAPDVRRPDEHIRRPHLRVKRKEGQPTVQRGDQRVPRAEDERAVRTAPEREAADPEPVAAPQALEERESQDLTGQTRQVPPPAGDDDPRFRYATYRTAPPDESTAKRRWLTRLIVRDETGEISTGFVLGAALIVVVLIGGIWVARLGKKVSRLEQRLVRIEQGAVTTVDAGDLLP